MLSKKALSLFSVVLMAVGVISGCSSSSKTSSNSSGSDGKLTVIKIATQSPLSGGSATAGEAIKLGAQLALEDNMKKFEKKGFELKLVPYDDQADPKKGVSNAQLMAADKGILGVIGHYNSGVAIPSSEIYEKYSIPMISPANTAVNLTERGLKTVNRICGRDDFQGPAGAQYAINTLKAKKIFIIQDKTTYGSGLAENFKKEAEKLGADIVGYEGITVGEKDFSGVLNQAVNKKPDLLYFAGIYTEGGLIIKQARDKGLDIPIMGGDGLYASDTVSIAGSAVKNVYITSTAGDATKTESGRKFADRYKAKFNKNIEAYSAYGYDSTGVLLKAIGDTIDSDNGKLPTREQVLTAVHSIKKYQGVLTKVGFDSKGDNDYAKIFIFKFDKDSYPPTQVEEIGKK